MISKHSFSPKMYCKNFENRCTNKNLTSKNVLEEGFLHGEIVSKGLVTIFPEKLKVLKFY